MDVLLTKVLAVISFRKYVKSIFLSDFGIVIRDRDNNVSVVFPEQEYVRLHMFYLMYLTKLNSKVFKSVSQEKFKASLKRIKKKHVKNIKSLGYR